MLDSRCFEGAIFFSTAVCTPGLSKTIRSILATTINTGYEESKYFILEIIIIIIIIIYTTYIAPYIWPVWPFIGAEEGPSKY